MTELMKYSMWNLGVGLDTEVKTHDNDFTYLNLVYAGNDRYGNPKTCIVNDRDLDLGNMYFALTGFDNFRILYKMFGDDFACQKVNMDTDDDISLI